MKIAWVGTSINEHVRGVERYIQGLMQGFSKAGNSCGVEVELLVGRWQLPYLEDFQSKNLKLKTIPRLPRAKLSRNLYLATRMHDILSAYDLVHYLNTMPIAVAGIPVVSTLHDELPQFFSDVSYPLLQKLARRRIADNQYRRSNTIIAVSNRVSEAINRRYGSTEKVRVVHNGLSVAPVERTVLLNRKPRSYFLFVGVTDIIKNLQVVIRALKFMDGVDLRVVGWSGTAHAELLTLIEEFGLSERVFMDGPISSLDELREIYLGAAGLVFPSISEGFGMPVLEAAALGVPILATGNGPYDEMIGSHYIRCDASSPNEWVNAMKRTLSGGEDILQMSLEAWRLACRLTWKRAVESTIDVYKGTKS